MSISSSILQHIENFTSQRDTELLAFSLLKSIREILSPIRTSILTLDSQDDPIMEISLSNGETCRYQYQNIAIPESTKASLDYINTWHLDELMKAHDEQYTSFHVLQQSRQLSQYLIITLDNKPSRSESYIIKGMLSIYGNFGSLLAESQTDELTGLMNRKTFEESIVKLYQGVEISHEPIQQSNWIAIIDLDHFKLINDRSGHLYGDEVLIHLARSLRETFRQEDMLFRFGGEEFVILIRNVNKKECSYLLGKLLKSVQSIALNSSASENITVSAGVCRFQKDIFHVTLLDQADQALYYSKQNGRNCVTFYDDIIEEGIAKRNKIVTGEVDFF